MAKGKKSKSTRVDEPVPSCRYHEPKSITVEKAANGFVITHYTDSGRSTEIARTQTEVNRISKRILEG